MNICHSSLALKKLMWKDLLQNFMFYGTGLWALPRKIANYWPESELFTKSSKKIWDQKTRKIIALKYQRKKSRIVWKLHSQTVDNDIRSPVVKLTPSGHPHFDFYVKQINTTYDFFLCIMYKPVHFDLNQRPQEQNQETLTRQLKRMGVSHNYWYSMYYFAL